MINNIIVFHRSEECLVLVAGKFPGNLYRDKLLNMMAVGNFNAQQLNVNRDQGMWQHMPEIIGRISC